MPSALVTHPPIPSLAPDVCTCGYRLDADIHQIQPVSPLRESRSVARSSDPDTSWEAARSVKDVTKYQAEVLRVFGRSGPTTDESAFLIYEGKQSQSGFRTRRSELVSQGLIVDSGFRQQGATGRRMIVWALTERGRDGAPD